MLKKMLCVLGILFLFAPMGLAREIGGVDLPEKISANGESLVLNGAGVREKYFVRIDLYAAGLYLTKTTSHAQKILAADQTMSLKIKILTGLLNSEKFQEAMLTGFDESTQGHPELFEKEIKLLLKAFSEEINNGDMFDLVYVPGEGVKIFKNDKKTPEMVIPGLAFKKVLFGIWLGDMSDKLLQELRESLLGK